MNRGKSVLQSHRLAEWKTWAITNRMTALSARTADIWISVLTIPPMRRTVQSAKSLFTAARTAPTALTVQPAARLKTAKGSRKFLSAGNFRICATYHNITTEEGKLLRCNRSIQAEGAFGQLKHNRNFKRFLTGGKVKVLAELLFLGLSQNIAHLLAKCNSGLQNLHLIQPKAYLNF